MVDLFESLIIIAPELILAITAMSLLMIGSFYQKKSHRLFWFWRMLFFFYSL